MSDCIMSTKLCLQSFVLYITAEVLQIKLRKEKYLQMNL